MRFEVLKDSRVVFWTEHEDCIPSNEDLNHMKKAGYTFKKDGKVFRPETKKKKEVK